MDERDKALEVAISLGDMPRQELARILLNADLIYRYSKHDMELVIKNINLGNHV
jgi:hypothetical protein